MVRCLCQGHGEKSPISGRDRMSFVGAFRTSRPGIPRSQVALFILHRRTESEGPALSLERVQNRFG